MGSFHLPAEPLGKEIPVLSEVSREEGRSFCIPAAFLLVTVKAFYFFLIFKLLHFYFPDKWDMFCKRAQFYFCAVPAEECTCLVVEGAGVNQCKQQPCKTIDVVLGHDNKGQSDVV